MASDTGSGLPEGRTTGRHAAPRLTVRGRMQLPVGRVLALTAVPTALLMGSIAPKLAFAADAKASSTSASHDTASAATAAAPTGGSCVKTSLKSLEAGTTTTTTGAGTVSTSKPTGTSTGRHSASTGSPTTAPAKKATPVTTEPTSTPTPSPTSTSGGSGGGSITDPVTGLLNGVGNLLGLDRTAAAPTTAAPSTTTPHTPAVAPVKAPTAVGSPTTTSHKPVAGPPPTPVGGGTTSTTSTGPTTAAEANKPCDISNLAAPLDTSVSPGEMPSVPWTLKSSNLELINTQFWGVVTVPTTAGPVRVLKFTAQAVNIGDLDMSTTQINQDLHVQGGPGTTSTMTGGTVTMYVESLSGTLASAEGIPLGWLGVNLTLTPDTLPQWLYDLIGDVPIPLTLSFTDAVAVQAGQFGGNLTIPGMHLYYTPPTS